MLLTHQEVNIFSSLPCLQVHTKPASQGSRVRAAILTKTASASASPSAVAQAHLVCWEQHVSQPLIRAATAESVQCLLCCVAFQVVSACPEILWTTEHNVDRSIDLLLKLIRVCHCNLHLRTLTDTVILEKLIFSVSASIKMRIIIHTQ